MTAVQNIFFAIGGVAGVFAIAKLGIDIYHGRRRERREQLMLSLLREIAANTRGKHGRG